LIARGRQRVITLARRLTDRFVVSGWQLDPLRWTTESTGALVARGPGGARVDLRFAVGARGKRSQVGVDFGSAPPTDDDAKAVIQTLVALLRESQLEHEAAAAHAR
jgi:hypothetical protein